MVSLIYIALIIADKPQEESFLNFYRNYQGQVLASDPVKVIYNDLIEDKIKNG